jgi:hypothetical protein
MAYKSEHEEWIEELEGKRPNPLLHYAKLGFEIALAIMLLLFPFYAHKLGIY